MDFAWSDGTNVGKHPPQGGEQLPAQLRRSRADTMPSSQTGLPFASYPTIVGRHRSGSVTLPSVPNQSAFGASLYASTGPSSPLDENASSTIASTLASLGLNDDDDDDDERSSTHRNSAPLGFAARSRAYTVATRNPGDRPDLSHLMAYSPFSPHTRNAVQQRPRAISLGRADNQMLPQLSSFDMTPMHRLAPPQDLRNSHSGSNLYGTFSHPSSHEPLNERSYTSNDFSIHSTQPASVQTSPTYFMESSSPNSTPAQIPSRALWLGNVSPSVSVPDLMQLFSPYGHVESARILSDKECAFVNFTSVESAVAAKTDLETRLGCKVAGTIVRVGFGKADVNVAMALTNEAGPNAQGPTRALWVGNIPSIDPAVLRHLFQPFGPIESVRVLSHKNCGFVNFEHQEDAVRARKMLQNKEVFGLGTGAVRIGFAKAPSNSDNDDSCIPSTPTSTGPVTTPDTYQATQWATAMMFTNIMAPSSQQMKPTDLFSTIAAERRIIMQQLGAKLSEHDRDDRAPVYYQSTIPNVPELGSVRTLDTQRLRELRKGLDSGQILTDAEQAADECMNDIIELCSDHIGNTIVQKLFEYCSGPTKQAMLEKIAPSLASIGVHKNGTWAAQKIIDYATTESQVQLISDHLSAYVPLLLLDQFGNYVVQCCIRQSSARIGPELNQYIFDAIVDKCWEIGQGRFGARAVRAILEDDKHVSLNQKVYVAAAVVQNAVLLTTNTNGTLLLNWYLEAPELTSRYRVLCPRLLPYLGKLCTHKLGSNTIFKIIQQRQEPDARQLLLNAIFNEPTVLDEVMRDALHGFGFVQKVLNLPDLPDRDTYAQQVRECTVNRLKAQELPAYKKLLGDLNSLPHTATTVAAAAATPGANGSESPAVDLQAMAMMANMYAAAMTAAASSSKTSPHMPDLAQFDQMMKGLLKNNTVKDEPDQRSS